MHGIIFSELKKFAESRLGPGAWEQLLVEAKLGSKTYLAVQEYPDSEIVALVSAASRKTKLPASSLLEAFGEFITPALMRMYGHLAKPDWRTLEFIENAERSIHTVVRLKNPGAHPPELRVTRTGKNEIALLYSSQRRMCSLAKGIAKGVASHYKEQITIHEAKCMLRGDPQCEITMRVAASASAGKV